MANDMLFLGVAYTAMIGLIGWFSWQLYARLMQLDKRLNAVEDLFKDNDYGSLKKTLIF